MTSRISFFKVARDEMKKLSWLTALQFLLFGLLIPFRLLIVLSLSRSDTYYSDTGVDKLQMFCSNMGLDEFVNVPFLLLCGILCALCAFSYVHSAVKLDLYHSLPLKREQLFGAKYLGSVLTFVTAYLGCQILGILVGVLFGAVSGRAVLEVGIASVQGILFFLCSYGGTVLAIFLTGKLLTTVCALGVFGGYVPLLLILFSTMREEFLWSSVNAGEYTSMSESLRYSSPWAFCIFWGGSDVVEAGVTGMLPSLAGLCQLVAMAAIPTLLALWLYRIRKTEAAGTAIAFRKLEAPIKILLAVPAALVAAFVGYMIFDQPVWEGIFILLFGVLACMIMEFIYRWDIRQVFRHKWHMAVTALVTMAVFFGIRYDVTGYNAYLPEEEEIQSMAVKEYWTPISYEYALGIYSGISGYDPRLLSYLETEDFAPLYQIAKAGLESTIQNGGTGLYMDASQTDREAEIRVDIGVKYRLKSGKEVYRHYQVSQDVYLENMEEMIENQEFREKYYPVLAWDASEIQEGWVNSDMDLTQSVEDLDDAEWENAYESVRTAIPSAAIADVLEAYKKDLEELSIREVLAAEDSLTFVMAGEIGYYESFPVDEKFVHTMETLKEIAAE